MKFSYQCICHYEVFGVQSTLQTKIRSEFGVKNSNPPKTQDCTPNSNPKWPWIVDCSTPRSATPNANKPSEVNTPAKAWGWFRSVHQALQVTLHCHRASNRAYPRQTRQILCKGVLSLSCYQRSSCRDIIDTCTPCCWCGTAWYFTQNLRQS